MGVLGLWRLVDATGKPVPLETLEGKVLAIDVSIWIHQVIQGYQDRRGNSLPNAHLIGLFNRICKLLYFKIKPVFVFDGGVPLLKKNTIVTRRKLKSIAATKAQKLKNDLINNLIKHTAVKGVLDKGNDEGESSATQQFKDSAIAGSSRVDDMYKLPDLPSSSKLDSDDYIDSDDEYQAELSPRKQTKWMGNIHTVDVNTEEFQNLPADVRYDILTDLKETRKQNSWGRIHELPAGSNNYSGFQVKRLLKRRYVQESLEVAEKEMGGKTLTLEELDRLLTDQGINTTQKQDAAYRIASDSTTRVVYVKDKLSQNSENSNDSSKSNSSILKEQDSNTNNAITDSMSVNSDSSVAVIENMQDYDLDEDWYSDDGFTETPLNDSELLPKSVIPKTVMNPALSYMLENSGLTRDQILKIVEQSKKNKKKSDGNSSQSSSKRGKRTPSRLSSKIKSKRKKLFDSTINESPKIKKEILNESKALSVAGSSSESEDFMEVPEKSGDKTDDSKINDANKAITVESSDFESDDFIEIQDVPIPEIVNLKKEKSVGIQITIKANEELQDDIFADVFTDLNPVQKAGTSVENKPTLNEFNNKASFKNLFPLKEIKEEDEEKVTEVKTNIKSSFQERECNKVCSIFSSPENSQIEFSNTTLPTTPQKISLNANVNNTSINSESSVETVTIKDTTTENNVQNKNIQVERSDVSKESEDLVTNDVSVNSELFTQIVEESNNDNMQEEDDENVIEIEKEPSLVLPTDEKELESMKQQLQKEQQEIAGSLGKLERQAIDITDQMRLDAQELLRLFGIPYLVAPMEAEAQCAYLERIKLTDGTITDDSDIWLFGGHCVYKNFFDNNKRVLQFLSNDIEHHFKLSRREMIQLALLVGSDYTNGLAGVGPVTALEILAAFPSEGEDILRGLRRFCSWFRAGKLAAPGKTTLRNKLKNVQIERGFPSQAVVQAYMCPMVDESKEGFSWGKPNLVLLGDYAKRKFGWTKLKFEEIMNPVIKKMNESKSQKGIDKYFKVHTVPKSIEATLSKRVQTAVQKLSGSSQNTEQSDVEASTSAVKEKPTRVRKTRGKRVKKAKDGLDELPAIEEVSQKESKSEITEEVDENKSDIPENSDKNKSEVVKEANEKFENVSIKNKLTKKFVTVNEEIIPQREQDKANALKTKLKAIEIFRKSKKGLNRFKKRKKVIKTIKEEANLSESSSSS